MDALSEPWVQALLSTFVISVVPNVLLYLVPMRLITAPVKGVLIRNVMMCFAAGGLLGDVFLHTLPHLMLPHTHSHSDHHHDDHDDHDHHDHDDAHVAAESSAYEHSRPHWDEDEDAFDPAHEAAYQSPSSVAVPMDAHAHTHAAAAAAATLPNEGVGCPFAHMHGNSADSLPAGHPPVSAAASPVSGKIETTHSCCAGHSHGGMGGSGSMWCPYSWARWFWELPSRVDAWADASPHNKAIYVGVLVLLGFIVFFLAERVASHYMSHQGGGHSHSHSSHGSLRDKADDDGVVEIEDEKDPKAAVPISARPKRAKSSEGGAPKTKTATAVKAESPPTATDSSWSTYWLGPLGRLAPAGWLNLLADCMHNFTDGIAVGAAYSAAQHVSGGGCSHDHGHGRSHGSSLTSLGAATAISVVFHEIPHEIGDFTVLVQSGFTKGEAIRAQFGTAIAAFAGTAVGLWFGGLSAGSSTVIVSCTAGGFLYIATVGMLGQGALRDTDASLLQTFWDVVGFALGVGTMVAVALFE